MSVDVSFTDELGDPREWRTNVEITLREDKRVMDRDAARIADLLREIEEVREGARELSLMATGAHDRFLTVYRHLEAVRLFVAGATKLGGVYSRPVYVLDATDFERVLEKGFEA